MSAEPKHRHSKNHLAAIGAKRIFQRFDLPNSIDTGSVHATFENGLLKIKAKLAATETAIPRALTPEGKRGKYRAIYRVCYSDGQFRVYDSRSVAGK